MYGEQAEMWLDDGTGMEQGQRGQDPGSALFGYLLKKTYVCVLY